MLKKHHNFTKIIDVEFIKTMDVNSISILMISKETDKYYKIKQH